MGVLSPSNRRLFRRHNRCIRTAAASLGEVLPASRHSKESAALLRAGIQACQLPTGDNLFETEPTTPRSAIATARQQVLIQLGSSRSTIQLQPNARSSPITTVQRRIFNPLSQLFDVAEGITNCEPEKAGIGVNKARREPPMTPVSVD